MSIMPLIFIFDLAMCILVPIYLFIVYRDKLMSENKVIANLVDLESCFDSYISNEIKMIKEKMYSTQISPVLKFYG